MRTRVGEVRAVSVIRAGAAGLLLCQAIASAAGTLSQPLILDTLQGIHDGHGGLVLQTAPLSREPIVEPAQPKVPARQSGVSNVTIPVFVTPYLDTRGSNAPASGQPNPPRRP